MSSQNHKNTYAALLIAQMLARPMSRADSIARQDRLWSLSDGSSVSRDKIDAFMTVMREDHALLLLRDNETVDTNQAYTELVAITITASDNLESDCVMYVYLILSDARADEAEVCWRFSDTDELRDYLSAR